MRELELIQENMEYQRLLTEKKLLGTSINIMDSVTDSIKDWAFEFGTAIVLRLIRGKNGKEEEQEEDES